MDIKKPGPGVTGHRGRWNAANDASSQPPYSNYRPPTQRPSAEQAPGATFKIEVCRIGGTGGLDLLKPKDFWLEIDTARDAAALMPKLAKRFRAECYSDKPPRCVCCHRPFVRRRPFVVWPPPLWVTVRMGEVIQTAMLVAWFGVCGDCAADQHAIVSAVSKAMGLHHVEFREGAA